MTGRDIDSLILLSNSVLLDVFFKLVDIRSPLSSSGSGFYPLLCKTSQTTQSSVGIRFPPLPSDLFLISILFRVASLHCL